MIGSRERKGAVIYGALAVGLVAVIVATFTLGRAKVTGGTPEQRVACIARLADEKPWGAADAIAAAAADDPDPAVRQAALVVLGRFIDPKYRPLIEAATEDPSPAVRAGAAGTLGLYSDDAAAERLGTMAAQAPEEQVRLAAIQGLGRLRRRRSVLHLVRIIEDEGRSAVVRRRALDALGRHLGARFRNVPDPADAVAWRRLMRRVRRFPAVRKALEGAPDRTDERRRP